MRGVANRRWQSLSLENSFYRSNGKLPSIMNFLVEHITIQKFESLFFLLVSQLRNIKK